MNFCDYIRWRGDLTFEQDPFNEVDNLILSYVAYSKLDTVISGDDDVTFAEAAKRIFDKFKEEDINKEHNFTKISSFLLRDASQCNRFKNCCISKFVSMIDEDTTEQFCAMQISCDDGIPYIAFRGTDDTVVGWHEDFQLAYKVVNAQKKAADYLNNVISPLKKYRVGGHSKGGNLAVYASAMCDSAAQKRIIQIYSNDGPGINDEIYSYQSYKSIEDRILKIMPKFDVFGILFNDAPNIHIIDSDQFAIMQHDGASWQIMANHFVEGYQLEGFTENLARSLNKFIRNSDEETKEIFVSQLFEVLDQAGLKTISDFATGGLPVLVKFIQSFDTLDEESRQFGVELLKVILDASGDEIKDKIESIEAVQQVRKRVQSAKSFISIAPSGKKKRKNV